MNRRSLFAHAAVAVTGGAAIAFAVPGLETRAAAGAASSIEDMFQAWAALADGPEIYDRYILLQSRITSAEPASAKELAMQIYVETDCGGSEMRDEFFDRIKSLAFAGGRDA